MHGEKLDISREAHQDVHLDGLRGSETVGQRLIAQSYEWRVETEGVHYNITDGAG